MLLSPSKLDIAAVKDLSSTIQAQVQDLKKLGFPSQLLAPELSKYGLQDATVVESTLRSSLYLRRQSLLVTPPSETTMETFRASLKELHRALCVAPKWQGWDDILTPFRWAVRPFRATPGLIDRKLKFWTETETSAADSSLFTSFGVWKSPKTAPTFFIISFGLLATSLMNVWYSLEPNLPMTGCIDNPDAGKPGEYCTWNHITVVSNIIYNGIQAMVAFTVAASLRFRGDVKTAQKFAVFMGGLCAVYGTCCAVAVFTGAFGQFYKYYPPEYGVAWLVASYELCISMFVIVHAPKRSFYAMFFGFIFGLVVIAACTMITNVYPVITYFIVAAAVFFAIRGTIYIGNRNISLKRAALLSDADAERYNQTWQGLKSMDKFDEDLRHLDSAWSETMARASLSPKSQTADTFERLYLEADAVCPIITEKSKQLAQSYGGISHASPVKAEGRALQKVWRTYGGNWRCLCDLARTSIEFPDLASLTACLRGLSDDPEVELLCVHDSKNRMTNEPGAKASGGYRDVQLCARLLTNEAVSWGVDSHLFEIQLHLTQIYKLKSEGGHKSYVLARNLRGN